jgi:hypothetical protein
MAPFTGWKPRTWVSAKRILRKISWGISVSGAMEKEIKKGEYAVIAIGMKGDSARNISTQYLTGDTTAKLISRIQKTSIWCCP